MSKGGRELPRLFGYLLKHWFDYLLGGTLIIASEGVTQITLALLLKRMIDSSISGSYRLLLTSIGRYGLLIVVAGGLLPFAYRLSARAVEKATQDWRQDFFDHVQTLPLSYFEKVHSGDTISRLTNDISASKQVLGDTLLTFCAQTVTAVVAARFLFLISWKFTLLTVVIGIAPLLFNRVAAKPLRRISVDVQSSMAELNSCLKDMVDGIGVSRAYVFTNRIVDNYRRVNVESRSRGVHLVHWQSLTSVVNSFFGSANFLAIVALGSYMVVRQELTPGEVVAATQFSQVMIRPFKILGDFWSSLQQAQAAASRVFSVLDEPQERMMSTPHTVETHAAICLKKVFFTYSENLALDGLSLQANTGTVTALVGPSGGGKSTVLKLLLGLYPACDGEISVAGRPLCSFGLEELRNMIAYVPQDTYLYSGTILENIAVGRAGASEVEIVAAARAANAHDFILGFPEGYQTQVGERGAQLSGGQRQRIAIARAVLKDAPILLLDEATSNLDSESELLVRDALRRLMQRRTTLVVTHRLSTVQSADMIYVIVDGKEIEIGRHEDLMALGMMYRHLYDISIKGEAATQMLA